MSTVRGVGMPKTTEKYMHYEAGDPSATVFVSTAAENRGTCRRQSGAATFSDGWAGVTGWRTAGNLVVPENLSLVFLPPYSPTLTRSRCSCQAEDAVAQSRRAHNRLAVGHNRPPAGRRLR
jgi:hypothetical protein